MPPHQHVARAASDARSDVVERLQEREARSDLEIRGVGRLVAEPAAGQPRVDAREVAVELV
jgi:hypothetical protein